MAHARLRHVLPLLKKKLKFSRVVTVQGARQTGKSFLARDIIPKALSGAKYVSLDDGTQKALATQNPNTFLISDVSARPLIIDEAQKAPELFDAVKLNVDENPEPGRFILLGSTEFSREVRIRESLTGRLSRIRIYPFNLAESLQLPPNPSKLLSLMNSKPRVRRADVLRYLDRGGFPGIFSVRSQSEAYSLLKDWLSLVCERDILQFKASRPDPELARDILEVVPILELADPTAIMKKLRKSPLKVRKQLLLLEQLFAVHRLRPHRMGTGKARYLLCDCGLAGMLGASLRHQLTTAALSEQLSQRSYRLDGEPTGFSLTYYRGVRGGLIDLIIEDRQQVVAIKVMDREQVDLRELEILHAFEAKMQAGGETKKITKIAWGPYLSRSNIKGVELWPWESLF